MRRVFLPLTIALAGCNLNVSNTETAGPDPQLEKNKEMVGKIADAFNSKEFTEVDKLFAENITIMGWGTEPVTGLEAMKEARDAWLAEVPDFKITKEEVVAEGNKVVAVTTNSGTFQGKMADMPMPPGMPFSMKSIIVFTIEEGKVTSWLELDDWMSVMASMKPGEHPTDGKPEHPNGKPAPKVK